MKAYFIVLLLSILSTAICRAELTNVSQPQQQDWGPSVFGVQMCISITNKEILIGSGSELDCCITNSSTNRVSIQTTGQPEYDFSVSLIDNSGKSRTLAPNDNGIPRAIYMNLLVGINSGEPHRCRIPINLDSAIPTGSYKIKVSTPIYMLKQWHTLSSNLLKVQIK